jgi:predicted nucleic acid-binding protein
MGPLGALIDSNIIIDFLLGIPEADIELGKYSDRRVSVVTWIEVLAGAKPHETIPVRNFLKTFQQLPITDEIAEKTVIIRKQTRLKLPDAVILATAETHGLLLVTRNTQDFSATHPLVLIPYKI